MRVDTKISNANVNRSYFQDKIIELDQSLQSNKNNLNISKNRMKSQQTNRSKTC